MATASCDIDISQLSQRDQRFMVAAFLSMTGDPKLDFGKIAQRMGMTNTGSARNAWYALRNKIGLGAEGSQGSQGTNTATPKPRAARGTGRKRKAVTPDVFDDEGDDATPVADAKKHTPSKRGRSTPVKKEPAPDDDYVCNEDLAV